MSSSHVVFFAPGWSAWRTSSFARTDSSRSGSVMSTYLAVFHGTDTDGILYSPLSSSLAIPSLVRRLSTPLMPALPSMSCGGLEPVLLVGPRRPGPRRRPAALWARERRRRRRHLRRGPLGRPAGRPRRLAPEAGRAGGSPGREAGRRTRRPGGPGRHH